MIGKQLPAGYFEQTKKVAELMPENEVDAGIVSYTNTLLLKVPAMRKELGNPGRIITIADLPTGRSKQEKAEVYARLLEKLVYYGLLDVKPV